MNALRGRLAFEIFVTAVFVWAAFETREFNDVGTWFPRYSAIVGTLLGASLVVSDGRLVLKRRRGAARTSAPVGGPRPAPEPAGSTATAGDLARKLLASWFSWYLLLTAAMALVGTWIAVLVWLPATMLLRARSSVLSTVIATTGALTTMWLLSRYLGIRVPPGMFL